MIKKKYKISEGMTPDEDQYVRMKLMNYNLSSAPPKSDYISLDIKLILKDDKGLVYGGLIGKIYRACLFIDILWVDPSSRGMGFGEKLVKRAEALARQEKCVFIHLDTFSFQAPVFYEKQGFETFGILEGYEDGIKRYFLKKDLV